MTRHSLPGLILLDAAGTVLLFPIYAFVRWVVVWGWAWPPSWVLGTCSR